MKNNNCINKSFLLIFLISLFTLTVSCENEYDNVSPSIIIENYTKSKVLMMSDVIDIKVSYNVPVIDSLAKWYVNGRLLNDNGELYGKGNEFKYKTNRHETLIIKHEVESSDTKIFITFEYDVKMYKDGFYVINYSDLTGGHSSIDYLEKSIGLDGEYDYSVMKKDVIPNENENYGDWAFKGVLWNGYRYIISKKAPHVSKIDPYSFSNVEKLSIPGDDVLVHDFVCVDNNYAVISSNKGLYLANITNMTVDPIDETTMYGDIFYYNNKLYSIRQRAGLILYEFTGTDFIKINGPTMGAAILGFAQTADKNIWFMSAEEIIKIDPVSNKISPAYKYDFPDGGDLEFGVIDKWKNWRTHSLIASDKFLFFPIIDKTGKGNMIYKFDPNDLSTLEQPFIKGENSDTFAGVALVNNKDDDNIIALYKNNDVLDQYSIVFYGIIGAEERYRHRYENNYQSYPSNIMFEKDMFLEK